MNTTSMIRSVLAALLFVVAATPFASAQYDTIPRPTDRPVIIQQQPLDESYQRQQELPWNARPFKDKLRYGLNITTPSLSFFGGNSYFSFDISPMAGIRVTPSTTAGIGATYSYFSQPVFTNQGSVRLKASLLGGRLFVQQHLNFLQNTIPGLFLWGEAEQFQILSYKLAGVKQGRGQYNTGFLVGGGYGVPAGEPGFQITLLYQVNYDDINVYSSSGSPLVIRFGYWFK